MVDRIWTISALCAVVVVDACGVDAAGAVAVVVVVVDVESAGVVDAAGVVVVDVDGVVVVDDVVVLAGVATTVSSST